MAEINNELMTQLLHMLSNHPNILVKPIEANHIDIHWGSNQQYRISVKEIQKSEVVKHD